MWCSSFGTHILTCVAHYWRREVAGEGGGSGFDLLVSFIFYLFGASIEEAFARFFPLGFSQDKSLCSFFMVVLVYLSVILFICFYYENEMKY